MLVIKKTNIGDDVSISTIYDHSKWIFKYDIFVCYEDENDGFSVGSCITVDDAFKRHKEVTKLYKKNRRNKK